MSFKVGDEVFEPRGMTIKDGCTGKVIKAHPDGFQVLLDIDPDNVWPDPVDDFSYHKDYGLVLSMRKDKLALARNKKLDLL